VYKAIAARDVYVERARIAEVNERAANDRLRSASEEIRRLSESRAAEVGVGGIDVLNESAEKVDEVTIVELTNRIVELNERIRNRDESIDSQGWTINSQGSTINSQRRVIDSQRSIIDMGNDKIDKLTAEIVEQNLTIESLKKELAIGAVGTVLAGGGLAVGIRSAGNPQRNRPSAERADDGLQGLDERGVGNLVFRGVPADDSDERTFVGGGRPGMGIAPRGLLLRVRRRPKVLLLSGHK
jgi:hypothetical protein